MPQDHVEFSPQVERMTQSAERGENLSRELNSMSIPERLQMARQMDQLNEQRRQSNPNLPDLQITSTTDAGGTRHLQDIQAVRTNANMVSRMTGNNKVDVYDPPAAERTGSGMLQQGADSLMSRRQQLDAAEQQATK